VIAARRLLLEAAMQAIAEQLVRHGATVVFGNVFAQQLGVPVPAEPTLVLSGSLAARGLLSPVRVGIATLAAATLADAIWFVLGRRFGPALRRAFRRRSAARAREPAARGAGRFERWGLPALLVVKFLPGAPQLLVAMAGERRVPFGVFVLYDLAGTFLWASLPITGGMLFHGQVEAILAALSGSILWVVLAAAAVVAAVYYGQRSARRKLRASAAPRA
jgi:membrane protein DedA with SNARE-associated domain